LGADAHTVADPLDAHLLERRLVHLHEYFTGDVVLLEEVYILGAVDSTKPVSDLILIPMPDTIIAIIHIGMVGHCRTGVHSMIVG
jgi:hypothetical protein